MDLSYFKIGFGEKQLMFAEEGQANQGDINFAFKMIDIAYKAGANGIEFQLGIADDLYFPDDEGFNIYKQREFDEFQIKDLVDYTHSKNMIFQVAPLSNNIIDLLKKCGTDVFTINAMDLTNPFMLDAVSESNKPFWLATLMGREDEIDWSINYLNSKKNNQFGLLHGQHIMAKDNSIGVPPEYTQLDCIELFKAKYNLPVGFVDHTPSLIMPSLAAAKGADIIFKHISPEKGWIGPDHGVCLDPEAWKQSKTFFDYACMTHGSSKNLTQDEISDRTHQRRSLYFNKEKKTGENINHNDLVALRPGGGFDPKNLFQIIGKKLIIDVEYGTPVDEKIIS